MRLMQQAEASLECALKCKHNAHAIYASYYDQAWPASQEDLHIDATGVWTARPPGHQQRAGGGTLALCQQVDDPSRR
ncbi:hypothetical protein AOLI_G00323080 [Acnodon oligacanthus]